MQPSNENLQTFTGQVLRNQCGGPAKPTALTPPALKDKEQPVALFKKVLKPLEDGVSLKEVDD